MNKYIISIAAILATSITLSARDFGPSAVKISGLDVYRHNDRMNVEFVVDISDIELGKNQQLIYTPVLTSKDGSHSVSFDKIVLNGRNIAILEERSPKTRVEGSMESVRRMNGTAQTIRYSTALSYHPWMDNSTLYLSEDMCGCGDLKSQDKVKLICFGLSPEATQALTLFVEPEIEEPKIRYEKGSATVDFVVNEYTILPDYHNNRAEIDKIISTIDIVRKDRNVEITDINIHGYASPEDTYEHNTFLAENRTRALTDYVKGLYSIPSNIFTTTSTPEDWDGLREYVSGSSLEHRQEILDIIDDATLEPDVKDWRIKMRYPQEYNELLHTVFPVLRRSDYIISYIVRPFSPEEALEVMKVNPKQVSLYEMFWAAQSLGINTAAYNDVMLLAVETYPEEPVANYNAAIVAVNKGEYDAALKYLEKVPESAKTLNIRGVIALRQEDLSTARKYFGQSAAQGLDEAARNYELLDGVNILCNR